MNGRSQAVALVETASPGRYAKQLAAHLGRRCEIREEGPVTRIVTSDGECVLSSAPGLLVMQASAATTDDLERVKHVVGSHLERFGERNELTVEWRVG